MASGRADSQPDLFTVAAIAIVAASLAGIIHEGLGHGGMCLVTGGRPLALSSVHFECSTNSRLVAAGGTLANLLFGAIFWLASRAITTRTEWRYCFWLMMTFNLFRAGGYFLFSGIGNFGDWADVITGWQPVWAWRTALTLLGAVSYFLIFIPFAVRELRPFLGTNRVRRARRLTLVPYFSSGIFSCIAGAFNPVSPMLILLSAAASSFGGDSGLAWMWNLLRGSRIPDTTLQMPELRRSWTWITSAAILAILFVTVLGRGVKFHSS